MAVRRNISQKDLLAEDKKIGATSTDEDVKEDNPSAEETGGKKKKEKTHIIPVKDTIEYPENEDEHMMESNTFLDVVFDENFEYIIRNPIKKFFGCLLWMFGMTLLPIITFFMYGFKVKNKKYIRTPARRLPANAPAIAPKKKSRNLLFERFLSPRRSAPALSS